MSSIVALKFFVLVLVLGVDVARLVLPPLEVGVDVTAPPLVPGVDVATLAPLLLVLVDVANPVPPLVLGVDVTVPPLGLGVDVVRPPTPGVDVPKSGSCVPTVT